MIAHMRPDKAPGVLLARLQKQDKNGWVFAYLTICSWAVFGMIDWEAGFAADSKEPQKSSDSFASCESFFLFGCSVVDLLKAQEDDCVCVFSL